MKRIGILLLLAGCVGRAPAPVSDSCGWLEPMRPDAGFQQRWTPAEIRNADRLDEKIVQHCPGLAPGA